MPCEKPQAGLPADEDLNNWAHHAGVATTCDGVLKAALAGGEVQGKGQAGRDGAEEQEERRELISELIYNFRSRNEVRFHGLFNHQHHSLQGPFSALAEAILVLQHVSR